MDALFTPLSSALGASTDQIKLITCLLISYPLGSIYIRIPADRTHLKHLFNIAVTLFYLLPVLHLYRGLLELLVSILATYVLAGTIKGHAMPWIVFVFVLGHLTVNQVIRAFNETSYESVDITGAQMVLTMKLTTFAWNVWDGQRPVQDLDKWQLEHRVTKMPSLLEFLGYSFYFPGFLVGPYLEFTSYMGLINETVFKTVDAAGKKLKRGRIPTGRKRVAYTKFVTGLAFLGAFVFYSPTFNYTVLLKPWFKEKPFGYRFLYFQLCGFFERSKYYAIWTLTEGASILTGLGFTGWSPSGEAMWNGAANVKKREIETPSNFKVLLDSWNMKTNVWLRECVYKRVTPRGKKPGFWSSMLTFLASAIWHGVAPGYYLTFILGGFITTAGRLSRGTIRPLLLGPPGERSSVAKRVYDVIGGLSALTIMNFATVPFMLLTVKDSLEAWATLRWYGLLMVFGALAFFYAGGERTLKGVIRKREKEGRLYVEPKPNMVKSNGVVKDDSATVTSLLVEKDA